MSYYLLKTKVLTKLNFLDPPGYVTITKLVSADSLENAELKLNDEIQKQFPGHISIEDINNDTLE